MKPQGRFIGEPIEVEASSIAPGALASGGPACPARFAWRGREYHVARVLETGRRLSPDGYVRQHRFRVVTAEGMVCVIACDRKVRRGANPWQMLVVEESLRDR